MTACWPLLSPLDTAVQYRCPGIPFWEGSVALRHLKRLDQAISKYALADKLSPNDVWILNDWGVALSDMNLDERAIEKFARQSRSPHKTRALQRLGTFAEYPQALRRSGRVFSHGCHA